MPSRRQVLVAAPIVSVAGCLQDSDPGAPDQPEENASTGEEEATADDGEEQSSATEEPSEETIEHSRFPGEADPITVEREEWDEHVEYIPEDDEVTFVEAWGWPDDFDPEDVDDDEEPPERVPELGRRPWDRWKYYRAHEVASQAARDAVIDALGLEQLGYSISPTTHPDARSTAVVVARFQLDNARDEPPASPDEIAAVTPAEVTATYVLGDQQFEETYDTMVEYETFQVT